ncbi:signal transduction protein [Idiomarina xiamenensis 10-D-4]|uniref:Signal transduction protein n=1 Tax=Idiomarina xiamenensis 10-D-4 TaxID=740709 RepID=K2KM39_9GAMM|nr:signal transduction protein [Idiomarina xiamenensis 10-D-4]
MAAASRIEVEFWLSKALNGVFVGNYRRLAVNNPASCQRDDPFSSAKNALYLIVLDKLERDDLQLPALPGTADAVARAAADDGCNLQQLATVIQRDPALTASLIKLANSAYLGGRVRAESLMQALTRIGLRRIRLLATALSVEQLFVPHNEIIRDYYMASWCRCRDLAAACAVLAPDLRAHNEAARLHTDVALLAGMVAGIGALPVLAVAEQHQASFANPSFITDAIEKLDVRVGPLLLQFWQFGENLLEVAQCWRDGLLQPNRDGQVFSYADVVHLAGRLTGHLQQSPGLTCAEYHQLGFLPSLDYWQQDTVQQRYQSIQQALGGVIGDSL